jgi:bifunctional DNase/RNase
MELVGVRVEVPANTPVVVLREMSGQQRLLPIVIGSPEASSIHAALEGIEPARPLTHDLMVDVLTALQVSVVRVVITEMRDHIFFAELHVRDASGAEHHISSRPSDGLAIAARTGCPIFATEELLAEAGQVPPAVEEDDEAIIDEFRDFLDDLNPDDFRAE